MFPNKKVAAHLRRSRQVSESVSLIRGGSVSLYREMPGLHRVGIGLGWDTSSRFAYDDFDLDASVFMLNQEGKLPNLSYFVFYNNLRSPDRSVLHTGDNRTGRGEGDDEAVFVELDRVGESIRSLVFVATIHLASQRKQNFGQVHNAYIRLYDAETGREILRYRLEEEFYYETGIAFGKLFRDKGDWRFTAIGEGVNNGLESYIDLYS